MERVVSRTELRSVSPESSSNSNDAAIQRLRASNHVEIATRDPEANPGTLPNGNITEPEDLEFRLFSRPGSQSKTINAQSTQRIRVRSPSTDPTNAGFIRPERSGSHYFTSIPTSATKVQLNSAALTPAQVLALSTSPWPGSTYEWKVQHLNAHSYPTAATPAVTLPTPSATVAKLPKQCKLSKAARIRHRVRLAKAKADREAVETAGAAEREKKAARNREKKLKKRAREKAKKAEGSAQGADGGAVDESNDSEDG